MARSPSHNDTSSRADSTSTPSPSVATFPPSGAQSSRTASQAPAEPLQGSTARASSVARAQPTADDDERRRRIAEKAYYRAEQRGFAPGGEEEDWLEAEKEIDRDSE